MSNWLGQPAVLVALVLACSLALYLLYRYLFRRAIRKLAVIRRIAPDELLSMMERSEAFQLVDLRARVKVDAGGLIIRGAKVMHPAEAELHLRDTPRGEHLVFYCS